MARLIIDPQHVEAWCDEIIDLIEGHDEIADTHGDTLVPAKPGLRHMAQDLIRLHSAARADGYPRDTSGARGAPANVVETFTEPDGTRVELPVPQHSDPTGDIVAQRLDHPTGDPIYTALNAVIQGINNARLLLEAADSSGAKAKPPVDIDEHTNDGLYCIHHARHGYPDELVGDKGRNGECQFCTNWGYLYKTGDRPTPRPPRAILDLRARGKERISQSDIARLCPPPKTTTRARRKRKR